MATGNIRSEFTRSYNSMSGSDIKAVFGGKPFTEIQAISFAVTREKAPIYTMGSADPRSYSRNKRGIAGSMVWTNFDRHALLHHFTEVDPVYFVSDIDDVRPAWDSADSQEIGSTIQTFLGADLPTETQDAESEISRVSSDQQPANPWYTDQIPPFDIVLVANNEYGACAKMKIIGIELLNDGIGMSTDDPVIEAQATFVARTVLPWVAVKSKYRQADGTIAPGTPV